MSDEQTKPDEAAEPAAPEGAEAPAEAPTDELAAEALEAPAEEPTASEGGILEDYQRKPDSSHAALAHLLLIGEDVTHELLDEIEKRNDVTDVRLLVGFCRSLLGEREG